MEVWTKRCRKASLGEEIMVPKNEVWSRKVSETKAHRAGRYRKEMAGVPESDECRKRDLECWKGTGKRRLE